MKVKIDKEQREHYCSSFRAWLDLMIERENQYPDDQEREFARAAGVLELAVTKSCLLDRMIYAGEKPSRTPCPVHEGRWSGCHGPWPGDVGTTIRNGEPERIELTPNQQCQEWYDAGCRCFQHSCGCTTGWQPDEHCGCLDDEGNTSHSRGVKIGQIIDGELVLAEAKKS